MPGSESLRRISLRLTLLVSLTATLLGLAACQRRAPEPPKPGPQVTLAEGMERTVPSADGVLIRYRVLGKGEPALILIHVEAQIGIDEEGKLSAKGTVDPDTLASVLDVDLKSIDLRSAQPYIARVTEMTLMSGKLGAKGKLELTRDEAESPQPRYAGTVELTKLRTIDNALEQDFIRCDQLKATGINYDAGKSQLVIKEIDARRPYARVIIASNGTVNITEVLKPASTPASANKPTPPSKPAESSAAGDALDVRIGLVRLDKGSANFADYTLRPNFATGIQELSGTITGLSSKEGSRAKVDLDGKVDAYAPVTIDGEVNYLSADSYTDLKLAFDNMIGLVVVYCRNCFFSGYRWCWIPKAASAAS